MSIWRKLRRMLRTRKGLLSLALILLCIMGLAGLFTGGEDEIQEVVSYENGQLFFGLSPDGVLTLYQGPPEENQVIETFFRIDTDLLKSALPPEELDQLVAGIRIYNSDDYEAVLAAFKPYAAEQ